MRTIETQAEVSADGFLTAHILTDLPPGKRQVVIVIEESKGESDQSNRDRTPLRLGIHPVGLTSESFTFRREDIYDDGF